MASFWPVGPRSEGRSARLTSLTDASFEVAAATLDVAIVVQQGGRNESKCLVRATSMGVAPDRGRGADGGEVSGVPALQIG